MKARLPAGAGATRAKGWPKFWASITGLFCAAPALALATRGRQLIQFGREEERPTTSTLGEVTYEGLGGIAAIGRYRMARVGRVSRDVVDKAAGEGAARARGDLEFVGQRFFEREFEANG